MLGSVVVSEQGEAESLEHGSPRLRTPSRGVKRYNAPRREVCAGEETGRGGVAGSGGGYCQRGRAQEKEGCDSCVERVHGRIVKHRNPRGNSNNAVH